MQTLTTGKIVGIIIGLLVLGGVGYMAMQGSGAASPETKIGAGVEKAGVPASDATPKGTAKTMADAMPQGEKKNGVGKASFKDLLAMTTAQKCTVSQSSDISKSTGTFYFSGGKGRGTFENTVISGPGAGVTSKNSMIMEGETIHVWDETSKQGMTMSVATTPGASTESRPMAEQFNQDYNYTCEPWKAVASMFALPGGVTFLNMSEMMKGMGMPQ